MRQMSMDPNSCQSPRYHSAQHQKFQYPKLRSILLDKSEAPPNTHSQSKNSSSNSSTNQTGGSAHNHMDNTHKNKHRPIFRNKSDLEPRLRKKVTYRRVASSMDFLDNQTNQNGPVSILKKHSVSSEPSEPDIEETDTSQAVGEDCIADEEEEDTSHNQGYQYPVFDFPQSRENSPEEEDVLDTLPETIIDLHISEDDAGTDVVVCPNHASGPKYSYAQRGDTSIADTKTTSVYLGDIDTQISHDVLSNNTSHLAHPATRNQSDTCSNTQCTYLPNTQTSIDTNSEQMSSWNTSIDSDNDDSSLTDDVKETTPLRHNMAASSNYAKYQKYSVPRVNASVHTQKRSDKKRNDPNTYHLRPESQLLLMRPEIAKLRKTSC